MKLALRLSPHVKSTIRTYFCWNFSVAGSVYTGQNLTAKGRKMKRQSK